MPTLPPVPAVAKIGLAWQFGSDLLSFNNLHAHYTGPAPSNATCAALAADVHAAVLAHLLGAIGTNRAILYTRVTDLSSSSGGIGEHHGGNNGTRAGPYLPDSMGVLAEHSIARRYRGGKPRTFTPMGIASDIDTSGDWNAAALAGINTMWQAFWTALTAITESGTAFDQMVSVSYFQGSTWVPVPPVPNRAKQVPTPRGAPVVDNITSTGLSLRPGSQRRRNFSF